MTQQRMTEKQKEIYILSMTARILGQLQQKGIVILGGPAKNKRFKDKEILAELYASVVNAEEKCIILQKVNIIDFPGGKPECRKLIILAHSDIFLKEDAGSDAVDKKELKNRFASRKAQPLETGIMGEHFALIQSDLYVCKAPSMVFVKKGNLPIEKEFPIMNLFPGQLRDETIALHVRKEGLPVDA